VIFEARSSFRDRNTNSYDRTTCILTAIKAICCVATDDLLSFARLVLLTNTALSIALPPLNALRAFEAAARHLSFRKAAEELHVTPAAISHQLKALEDYLGVKLFRRANRRVELTPVAYAAASHLHEGFAAIVEAVELLRQGEQTNVLTVSAPPSFAGKWLMPRLHRFVGRHPEIDVRLSARMRSVNARLRGLAVRADINDASLDEADLAIRFGNGDFLGMRIDRLLDLTVAPMISPQLTQGARAIRNPADLRQHTLLHDDTGYFASGRLNWDCWLEAAGVSGIDTSHGVHFSHANLAIDAAVDGLGIVVSALALAAADLAAGRLVRPFDLSVPADYAYYIVCDPTQAARPAIEAFRNWLLEEARSPKEKTAAAGA
jgi:LysR family glycine cleavage system transcriptional activator